MFFWFSMSYSSMIINFFFLLLVFVQCASMFLRFHFHFLLKNCTHFHFLISTHLFSPLCICMAKMCGRYPPIFLGDCHQYCAGNCHQQALEWGRVQSRRESGESFFFWSCFHVHLLIVTSIKWKVQRESGESLFFDPPVITSTYTIVVLTSLSSCSPF